VLKDAENKSDAPADSEGRADATRDGGKEATATDDGDQAQEKPATSTLDADAQEAGANDADKQAAAAATPLAAAGGDGEIELPTSVEAPKPRPTNAPKSGSGIAGRPGSTNAAAASSGGFSNLPGVRRLSSQSATGDALAMTSMAGVARDQRAAQLCASVLQRQLLDASYSPDLLPLVPLKAGNVLDVPDAAFRARKTWYRLSFRCEVDTNATRVLSLTFRVGTAIPPDQWARLGLPVR